MVLEEAEGLPMVGNIWLCHACSALRRFWVYVSVLPSRDMHRFEELILPFVRLCHAIVAQIPMQGPLRYLITENLGKRRSFFNVSSFIFY